MADSPYSAPGFYARAIEEGRHRDIVGGRWEETGEAQMALLEAAGLRPEHVLLDIGAGSLRLGCMVVPYLAPGHYWATDASRALMLAGRMRELADPERLDPAQLIEDDAFAFPSLPDTITHALAFAVFPHLPVVHLEHCLQNLHRFARLERFLFTVFLAPDTEIDTAYRQRDGVVTHRHRVPFHLREAEVQALATRYGWRLRRHDTRLPRGQVLFEAEPAPSLAQG